MFECEVLFDEAHLATGRQGPRGSPDVTGSNPCDGVVPGDMT